MFGQRGWGQVGGRQTLLGLHRRDAAVPHAINISFSYDETQSVGWSPENVCAFGSVSLDQASPDQWIAIDGPPPTSPAHQPTRPPKSLVPPLRPLTACPDRLAPSVRLQSAPNAP
ncbi:hypothetical protein BKA80DRAFT_273986 [Phyllosticta citrichinensis]